MSSAPTDCRVPDPSDKLDAKADGQFQAVNRRAGYGDDRLDRIIATARKGWTLAAGEGLVLVQELDRLRGVLNHVNGVGGWCQECEDTYAFLVDENAKRKAILAVLREPSEAVRKAAFMEERKMYDPKATLKQKSETTALTILAAAVAAAEREVDA